MLINFRQGIVAQQMSGNQPAFLALNGAGVDLLATFTNPTIIAFAQGNADYLFQESTNQVLAWAGPFSNVLHYWLYWDINLKTGIRTFGSTQLAPVAQPTAPANPANDQHWFDTANIIMNVFNNGSWNVKVRLFAGEVNSGTLIQYSVGTQIGNNTQVRAGFFLFDDSNNPVKKFQTFGLGEFITTETPLASQFPKLQNFKLESAINSAIASQSIAQWKVVCFVGPQQLGVASSNAPSAPGIGVSPAVVNSGSPGEFVTQGYVSNPVWTFSPVNANVFCDATGNLTTTPPSVGSIQIIGQVVSQTTLFINPQQIIILQ